MFYEVTEPAKVLLDAGEEIPCDLMANILKFQLLQIKAHDQQRRETEQVVQPPLSTDVDMRYYGSLLDLVPPEACSVPLIMHCMVQQVEISTEQYLSRATEEPKLHDGPGLDFELVSFMLQSFLPLVHTEEERSHMLKSLLTTAQNEEDQKVQRFSLKILVTQRKYLDHVADRISDWTKEEELKREAMQLRSVGPAEAPNDEKATDSAEEEVTLEPVIRKGSLKAWKLEQDQLKVEEMAKKSKKESTPKGKQQQKEEAMSTVNKKSKTLPSGKKSRADTAGSSARTHTESITTTAPPVGGNQELHPSEEPVNGFTGYSMDGKLIHVSGRRQYLFPL
ncbi:sperm-associated antigen 17-like [Cottoperca gobio]|uniref:Sperm-associated antigen 17-like n=1 Tax=Cottoperca gobio TaxID=56716 RepID=A0A6J2RJR8_COTGO|nr:sperm-associated antigen 17-like [Cottoperca gobio]